MNGIIYIAVNRVNGKAYVGQTISTPKQRMWRHYFNAPFGLFGRALRKHGTNNFDCAVLERCSSKEALDIRETYWISHLSTIAPNGYNLAAGGRGALGIKHEHLAEFNRREDVRLRKRDSMQAENNHFYGKKHTPETLQKLSQPRPHMRGRKRPDVSARLSTMVGPKNHAFGKIYTEEERKKFGQPGDKNPRFGVKLSSELRQKIADGVKAYYAEKRRTA